MKKYKITENNITYDVLEHDSGTKFWFLNDKIHRENVPVVEYNNGSKYWYKNDKLHRINGPAVELFNGIKGYWYNGKCLYINSDEQLKRYVKFLSIS